MYLTMLAPGRQLAAMSEPFQHVRRSRRFDRIEDLLAPSAGAAVLEAVVSEESIANHAAGDAARVDAALYERGAARLGVSGAGVEG